MADLGFRENVMGPQPIAKRKPIPQDLLDTVALFLDRLADGKTAELATIATRSAQDEVANLSKALATSVKPGAYTRKVVLASARVNEHYFVKAKMTGDDVRPFTFQLRLGQVDGKWMVWEATNLTDARSGWTK